MKRLAAFSLAALGLTCFRAAGSDAALSIRTVEGPSWRADGVELRIAPASELQLAIASIVLPGRPPIRNFELHCRKLRAGAGAHCDKASFTATLPGWGRLEGTMQARFDHAQRWQAELDVPRRGLHALLTQDGAPLKVALSLRGQSAAELQKLAAAFALKIPGELSGALDVKLEAELAAQTVVSAEIAARDLSYSEPSGRYASDKLSADARLRFDSGSRRWDITLDTRGGQAYAEPLYFDFSALPLHAQAAFAELAAGWSIERLHTEQGKAGTLELSGRLGADFKPLQLDAQLDAQDLAPLLLTDLQPFFIGTALEGTTASGRASASLALREGAPQSLALRLDGAGFKIEKLGLSLDEIAGELNWSATASGPSKLRWRGGALKRVPIGASEISFRAQGRDFELLAPWRQPLLEGALKAERLALRGVGGAQLDADFQGTLEPLNLTALCKALGWPEFGGTLGGRLPGLSVRDDVWSVDGALEAQAFDGTLRIENLRAMQPFGLLPRVMADVEVRRLDLERLTGAFSFGRITGRLDGDVKGLRLLNWSPVAFDGRLYSTPGDSGKRRISQRAIDNISAIGGGPTGLLSRGFLSVFEDFSYERLGISCVLRDGVCAMDGVEPAKSKTDVRAYYLVKGRLLPRIDVVGYAQRVSWNNLVEQLKAAQASGGPELK